jgi:hypothetical protein
MNARRCARAIGFVLRNRAAAVACLLLTACAAPPANWVKAGADDAATAREAGDCRAQANAALANQQGINEDITATLGRNWQLSQTTPIFDQTMRQQAVDYSDQVFASCMRAKGFKKQG